jgi:hypothetical protein
MRKHGCPGLHARNGCRLFANYPLVEAPVLKLNCWMLTIGMQKTSTGKILKVDLRKIAAKL